MTILTKLLTIEQQLDKDGDTQEIRKAFWRVVGQIKRMNPSELNDTLIAKTTEIRNRLFKQKVILKTWKGLVVFFVIALLANLGFLWVLLYFEIYLTALGILQPTISFILLNGILVIVCIFVVYGVYPWGRYLGGGIARVKFEGFYRYSPVELGLKIEYNSYLRTTQRRRKWVFGFPIIWVFGSIAFLVSISWVLNPSGIFAPFLILILFGIFYIAIYYKKTGELYRFIRELRIAHEVKTH